MIEPSTEKEWDNLAEQMRALMRNDNCEEQEAMVRKVGKFLAENIRVRVFQTPMAYGHLRYTEKDLSNIIKVIHDVFEKSVEKNIVFRYSITNNLSPLTKEENKLRAAMPIIRDIDVHYSFVVPISTCVLHLELNLGQPDDKEK